MCSCFNVTKTLLNMFSAGSLVVDQQTVVGKMCLVFVQKLANAIGESDSCDRFLQCLPEVHCVNPVSLIFDSCAPCGLQGCKNSGQRL